MKDIIQKNLNKVTLKNPQENNRHRHWRNKAIEQDCEITIDTEIQRKLQTLHHEVLKPLRSSAIFY